jgi:hypothetical protein
MMFLSALLSSVPDAVTVAGFCLGLLLLTTVMHYEATRLLNRFLPRVAIAGRARLIVVVVCLFLAHVTEALVYATAYVVLARHTGLGSLGHESPPSFGASLYFSMETFSSLGYGDIVPSGALRLLAGTQALNGLLLIGWSASYAHIAMERFWNGELTMKRSHGSRGVSSAMRRFRPHPRPILSQPARNACLRK